MRYTMTGMRARIDETIYHGVQAGHSKPETVSYAYPVHLDR